MKYIVLFYLYLNRLFFEYVPPIACYFLIPLYWAILISVVFVTWQVVSYVFVKYYGYGTPDYGKL